MDQNVAGTVVSPETIEAAKESYERCSAGGPFLRDFYANFLASCPEAVPMFANSDFDRLSRLLHHALRLLLIYPGQPPDAPNLLERVAERHSRNDLDVDPRLYEPFVDSLIATVRAHDPRFTLEVEAAWRTTLSKGVAYMKSKY